MADESPISPSLSHTPSTDVLSAVYKLIPIQQIHPSAHQARKLFDEDSLLGLAESLKQEGLLQAITVRRSPYLSSDRKTKDLGYELISGERRWRAARLLGWKAIEAKVIDVISEGEAAAKSLLENLQREDLNPMEEAEGFAQLNQVDTAYWTQERIAMVAGKSRSYVTQSMALIDLPDSIQDDVRRRTYSRGHAMELCRLPSTALQLEVAKQIPGHLTREKTRKLVDSLIDQRKKSRLKNRSSPKAESIDLLVDLWPEFSKNPWITTPGHIDIRYLGDQRWAFEITASKSGVEDHGSMAETRAKLREELGQILIRMGRSLSFDTQPTGVYAHPEFIPRVKNNPQK